MSKNSAFDNLWYALYAFAGLGLELVLAGFLEPLLFGWISGEGYADARLIVHWLLTGLCWGCISVGLIYKAGKKLEFKVIAKAKPDKKGLAIGVPCVLACIILNTIDWGTLKIIGEFQNKGPLLFVFQYIYYLFEVVLVYLIVAFGQRFVEALLKKKSMLPWGGIVLCCTWGAIHILTRQSLATGIGVMAFALLYGMIYLLFNRNTKYVYIAIAIAFMI